MEDSRPAAPCEISKAINNMARLKRNRAFLGSLSKSVYECVMCVKTSNCIFLLLDVYSLRLLPYRHLLRIEPTSASMLYLINMLRFQVVDTALAEPYLIPASLYTCLCVCTSSISSMLLARVLESYAGLPRLYYGLGLEHKHYGGHIQTTELTVMSALPVLRCVQVTSPKLQLFLMQIKGFTQCSSSPWKLSLPKIDRGV